MLRPLALALLVVGGAVLASAGDDPAGGGLALEAGSAGPVRLAPLPVLPPGGDDQPYGFADTRADGTGRPVLFDPCRPVHVSVRRDGAPSGADVLLDGALRDLERATGLDVTRGPDVTGPLPIPEQQALRRADGTFPPAVIGWAGEQEHPALGGGTLAVGGGTTWAPDGRTGEERLVSGLVVLDAVDVGLLHAGPDGDARLRGVLLHELAHLVGLGHVDDRRQLMHRESTGTAYASGDLRGLRAAGEGQCFQDW